MTITSVMGSGPESARLATLRSYAVLDTGPEPEFDAIVRLAAESCETRSAAITLVSADRCWFKASYGLSATEMPRETSFCGQSFNSSGLFVVPDALADDRFKHLPLVAGPLGFRFYAATPLRAPDGHSIGTLCVLDRLPREPTRVQLARLRDLADRVMALLETRRQRLVPPAETEPAKPPADAAALVLVVDDEDSVRDFTAEVLKYLGHEVLVASNGADALVRIAENRGRVRLVVTDLSMPIMNGLELVRALRRQPQPPDVVVMSGHFDQQSRALLRAEGVSCMLGKPFSVDELKLILLYSQAAGR